MTRWRLIRANPHARTFEIFELGVRRPPGGPEQMESIGKPASHPLRHDAIDGERALAPAVHEQHRSPLCGKGPPRTSVPAIWARRRRRLDRHARVEQRAATCGLQDARSLWKVQISFARPAAEGTR